MVLFSCCCGVQNGNGLRCYTGVVDAGSRRSIDGMAQTELVTVSAPSHRSLTSIRQRQRVGRSLLGAGHALSTLRCGMFLRLRRLGGSFRGGKEQRGCAVGRFFRQMVDVEQHKSWGILRVEGVVGLLFPTFG